MDAEASGRRSTVPSVKRGPPRSRTAVSAVSSCYQARLNAWEVSAGKPENSYQGSRQLRMLAVELRVEGVASLNRQRSGLVTRLEAWADAGEEIVRAWRLGVKQVIVVDLGD